jgi:hypothetical protein
MPELKLLAAELPRELWICSMIKTLQPHLPKGFSLGITDDEYDMVRDYIVDIVIEQLNEYNFYNGVEEKWHIIDGNLYKETFEQ